jgi:hypothetical protein
LSEFEFGDFLPKLPVRNDLASSPGLPDGLFSYQKSLFGYVLEGLGMENIGIFNDHFEYFTAIRYIVQPFGMVSVHSA